MEHKFDWDPVKKELTETRTGDELVDGQQKKVEGRYLNTTIYPEATAIQMLKELKRQLHEAEVQVEQKTKRIEKLMKDKKPVDQSFYLKFKACVARDGIEKIEEAEKNSQDMRSKVTEQINKLEEAMGLKE